MKREAALFITVKAACLWDITDQGVSEFVNFSIPFNFSNIHNVNRGNASCFDNNGTYSKNIDDIISSFLLFFNISHKFLINCRTS